jgi:prepilin-type N-terminal cleavage/methylation domain-containing protein
MRLTRFVQNAGMSLLEITIAMAIFAVVMGVTATSLASFYTTMDIQEQRIEAMQASRGVLDALREKRGEFVDVGLAQTSDFPVGLLDWIEEQNAEAWPGFVREFQRDIATGVVSTTKVELLDHVITVECTDVNGAPAGAGDNPIQVRVISTWKDRRGHPLQVELVSLLSDR